MEALLDELDIKLLEVLQIDGKKSYTELATQFGTTVGTVSNRVQRLMDQGILRIVGVVNPRKTGNPFVSIIGMNINLGKLKSVIDELSKIKKVRYIAASTGVYNLFVEVVTSSHQEFYEILTEEMGKIDGIEKIDSSIVLEVHKQTYDFGVRLT